MRSSLPSDPLPQRIYLVGSHATGKTTLARWYATTTACR